MRCTQNVHFSTTPCVRTATSGLSCSPRGASQEGSSQLKRRTDQGQLLAQYRVPMHWAYTIAFSPSDV